MGEQQIEGPKKISRRRILKIGGALGILAAAAKFGIRPNIPTQKTEETIEKEAFISPVPLSPIPKQHEESPSVVVTQAIPTELTTPPTPTAKTEPTVGAVPSVTPEQKQTVDRPFYESFLFPDATDDEKKAISSLVHSQVEYYRKDSTIANRDIETLLWRKLIQEAQKELKSVDSIPVTLLESIIFVESGGDPHAKTKYAQGLCQVSPDDALEINTKMGFNPPLQLNNPKDNIKLSLLLIAHLQKTYPDPSLAVWAYHLGQKNMNTAIRTYCADQGIDASIMDTYDYVNQQTGTEKLITMLKSTKKPLNYLNLIQSQHVVSALKQEDAFNNDTGVYVPRIGAAAYLMDQFEKTHKHDTTLPAELRAEFGQDITT